MKSTINNLSALGFPYADQDHLLLKDSTGSKETRREKVADQHEIILLMGDNLNDFSSIFEDRSGHDAYRLVDQHADDFGSRFIILPNPIYGAWESAFMQNKQNVTPEEKLTQLKRNLHGYSE
jgi:5'-nucleotidase (lipoprotein e(P4) family)